MSQKQAVQSLEKIQKLLGELDFVLTPEGYYKDYGVNNGSVVRIAPIFDKGMSLDMQYNLSALSVTGHEIIQIVTGEPVALDKVPSECRSDVMRMLAELAPDALMPKSASWIVTMICTECRDDVSSYFNFEGVVKCIECSGYTIG